MRKKEAKPKRLVLARETLLALADGELHTVAGGISSPTACPTQCTRCHTTTCICCN